MTIDEMDELPVPVKADSVGSIRMQHFSVVADEESGEIKLVDIHPLMKGYQDPDFHIGAVGSE